MVNFYKNLFSEDKEIIKALCTASSYLRNNGEDFNNLVNDINKEEVK